MVSAVKVSAVIPAYNEESRIGDTIRALRALKEVAEIVVADDGSADNTGSAAKNAGADVVLKLKENRGKGEALARGLGAAGGDIICLVDADLGETAAEFGLLLAPVLAGEADMTVGVLPRPQRKAGFGLVMGLAAWGIRFLTGYRPVSPLSGQRVITRQVFEQCGFRSGFGIEVGLTIECLRRGFRLLEVPVRMKHRESGRNLAGFRHRGRQFVQVARTLWQAWRKVGV